LNYSLLPAFAVDASIAFSPLAGLGAALYALGLLGPRVWRA